jgi:hypothetical protein
MIDFIYIQNYTSNMLVYNTYNTISIQSFKKIIDKICISKEIYNNIIVIKTDISMNYIMKILGYSSKQYGIRQNIIIRILNT